MRAILVTLAATFWIATNEFVRNQLVLVDHWTGHYAAMGVTFPGEPVNGAVWGIWSLCFAEAIFVMAKRFSLIETTALAWSVGFLLMWLVVGNLGVLPFSVLRCAIPWSMLEAFGAVWVVKKLN
jgi:hypothetical protein